MNKYIKLLVLLSLFLTLIAVRFFESSFNDPLHDYFQNDYLTKPLPELNKALIIGLTLLRYLINSILSISIIYLLFPQKKVLKFSIKFYLYILIFLIITFTFLLNRSVSESYVPLFYVRRLLINPIFILILIPAFYYQKINE